MSTYIFAIGGTGSRVLRSMTMLLASGCAGTSANAEIVPIIFDYDNMNGDLQRTRTLMEKYAAIHNAIYPEGVGDTQKFFCTPLTKIKDKVNNQATIATGIQFNPNSGFDAVIAPAQNNQTFSDFLGLKQMNPTNGTLETAKLLQSLYDTSLGIGKELEMDFTQGFLGCPNIGCMVSQHFAETAEFKNFLNNVNVQNGDRAIIIGSVFGGTGASGIPMFLDVLRSNPKTATLPVAVIAMKPYYALQSPDQNSSPISSDTFLAKTKAAISSYELGNSVNQQASRIYSVGDPVTAAPFPNVPGKQGQCNPALFAELVAAIFAMDFVQANNIEQPGQQATYEFGMNNSFPIVNTAQNLQNGASSAIHWADFDQNNAIDPYIEPLMRFTLFEKFWNSYKPESNDVWYNQGIASNGANASLINDIRNFKAELDTWLNELASSGRALELFFPQNSYDDFLAHKKLNKPGLFGIGTSHAFDEDDIAAAIGKDYQQCAKTPEQFVNPAHIFMHNVDSAMREISDKIQKFN